MPKVPQSYLDSRRNEILDAAWACFARNGYHETTMQDICRESQLSPGAIYRYFTSKEAILAAISERSLAMGRRLIEDARQQAGGPLDSLEAVGHMMLGAFNHPMFETMTRVNIELWPEIVRNPILREGMRAELLFWHQAVEGILSDSRAAGELRKGIDPSIGATLFMCAYEGMRHYNLVVPEMFTPEALISLGQSFSAEQRAVDTATYLRASEEPGSPLGTRVTRTAVAKKTPVRRVKDSSRRVRG